MWLCSGLAAKEETQRQSDTVTWTATNLVVQIIAGIFGGNAISAAAKEHSFGMLGHTVAGAVGGAFSGYFLQTLAAMAAARVRRVRGGGHPNDGGRIRKTQHRRTPIR
jgi:uncharacterized membrane protein YeaQ/YmgE (transglycosylase-associated protein family)